MSVRLLAAAASLVLGCATASTPRAGGSPGEGEAAFAVDPAWPKPLPSNWILGQVSGVAVDASDHVWVLQRPRTLTDDERGAVLDPKVSKCCAPAPPVLAFDGEGNLLQAWGGPGAGYDWPANEHGISVDAQGFVWITGNGDTDGQILKFTREGKFVSQIGKSGPQTDSNDTSRLGKPAYVEVDPATNEVFVADGYQNRRVIVFDAATGAYKRHWGAYGNRPSDEGKVALTRAKPPSGPPSQQFGNPVHCVHVSHDGLVYVCDRLNDRIQVFHKDGSFVKELAVEPQTAANGSVWDLALSKDPGQRFLYVADGRNNQIHTLSRETGEVVGELGRGGRSAGQFHWVHDLAIDSKGNLYAGEVDTGKRVQKFVRKGP